MRKFNVLFCAISKRSFSKSLPNPNVRVRFAPSPTGHLHLGGLRTALYNYLFTLSKGGTMILRIEDTDQSRKVDGATEALIKDMEWAGVKCQEGPHVGGPCGPYMQSERLSIYQNEVERLFRSGSAYKCFCSDKRLDLLRRDALRCRQVPKYDNKCRYLSEDDVNKKIKNGETYCIRFKLSSVCTTFEDLIYGSIAYDVSLTEGDPVIMKSDNYPTYHFANVVDDHFMKITHVLRGVEWQISTTKHLQLYKALQWQPPQFAHLPLILNSDGTKLSKRQGDIRVEEFRKNGIFPNALINYITMSGGGFDRRPGEGIIPYTMEELADKFDLDRVNSHSSRLDPLLLTECNRLELKEQVKNSESLNSMARNIQTLINSQFQGKNLESSKTHVESILKWSSGRITHINELLSPQFAFLWVLPNKDIVMDDMVEKIVPSLCEKLGCINDDQFKTTMLKDFLKNFSTENNIKYSKLMKSLRKILSGLDEGPGVSEMMEILGKSSTIDRIKLAAK